jgi:hypothetical protein
MTKKKPQAIAPDESILEQYVDHLPNPATAAHHILELVPNARDVPDAHLQLMLTGFACGWLARRSTHEHEKAMQEQA